MPTMIGSKEIGGGYVRRTFTAGGERMQVGAHLSAKAIQSWPNHRELERLGLIAVFPPAGVLEPIESSRFALHEGFGKYSVIEGRKLNDGPLTRDEAEQLVAGELQQVKGAP
jgi:hypothetical protein